MTVKSRPSNEVVPEPIPAPQFDTTTPAQPTPIRRFTLADLPRYEVSLYPHLKRIFPHLHERMYGGWLRGCIQDNTCFFICGEATVALAQIIHDPLDPRPIVEIVFCLGKPDEYKSIVDQIVRWAKDLGAREIRHAADDPKAFARTCYRQDSAKYRTIVIFEA